MSRLQAFSDLCSLSSFLCCFRIFHKPGSRLQAADPSQQPEGAGSLRAHRNTAPEGDVKPGGVVPCERQRVYRQFVACSIQRDISNLSETPETSSVSNTPRLTVAGI